MAAHDATLPVASETHEATIHNPGARHTHTVIFLHGRDSTAEEFAAELFESKASDGRTLSELLSGIKWVFPTAEMLISARFGSVMSQWFDMYSTQNPLEREEEQNLSPSIMRIQDFIAQEAAMVGPENVVLGGISQGCAVAIHALLRGGLRLGGFVGLSSWLPKASALQRYENTAAIETPVFLSHAQDDEVIAICYGEGLRDTLSALGIDVCWTSYVDGGHWINEPQGVDDIMEFLKRIGKGST